MVKLVVKVVEAYSDRKRGNDGLSLISCTLWSGPILPSMGGAPKHN